MPSDPVDLLVIGGGPAGLAAAIVAAGAGLSVQVLDRSDRPDTFVDALHPRAVLALGRLGVDEISGHRTDGLRLLTPAGIIEHRWPRRAGQPRYGLTVSRHQLGAALAEQARHHGAQLTSGQGVERVIEDRGLVTGVVTDDGRHIGARWLIVADGALSPIGRALGSARDPAWPQGWAIRRMVPAARSHDRMLEIGLDLRDRDGERLAGYSWVFPAGDGRINVGIGVLSAAEMGPGSVRGLLERHLATLPDHWELEPTSNVERDDEVGRLPLGGSVGPVIGPSWLLAGDAAGLVDPRSGSGIDAALESGTLAGQAAVELVTLDDRSAIERYAAEITRRYRRAPGQTLALARLSGRPWLRNVALRAVTRSGRAVDELLGALTRPPS